MTESFITLFWMLIFFILFYIYIEVKITKLRKEMLSHYLNLENMMYNYKKTEKFTTGLQTLSSQQMTNSGIKNTVAQNPNPLVLNPYNTIDDLIPTKEETMNGLKSIEALQSGSDEWKSTLTGEKSIFEPYDNSLDGYASFTF